MIKTLIISVISFGAGAAVTYSLLSEKQHGLAESGQQLESLMVESLLDNTASETSVYTDYILQLEDINRNLNKELETLRAAGNKKNDKPEDEPRQLTTGPVDFDAYYNARKNSEEFNQYLQSVSSGNGTGYVADLAVKFNAEAVDTQWASNYEERLYRLFDSESMVSSFVPQSIQCKSRRCQIKVAVADFEQANQVMQEFSAAINNNQLAIDKSMVVSAPDINEGVVNLYVVRDANVKIYE